MPADLPLLFAKYGMGYALTFLGLVLGALAVLIPSMRRAVKKD